MTNGVLSIAKPHRMWVVCSKEDNKPFGVLSGDEHSYDKLEEFIGATGMSAYIVPFVVDKLEVNNTHRINLDTTNPTPFPQAEGLITKKRGLESMPQIMMEFEFGDQQLALEKLRSALEEEQKEKQELEEKIKVFKEKKLAEEEEERIERIAAREELSAKREINEGCYDYDQ